MIRVGPHTKKSKMNAVRGVERSELAKKFAIDATAVFFPCPVFLWLDCFYLLNVSVLVAIRHDQSTHWNKSTWSLPFGALKHEQQIRRKKVLARRMDYTKAASSGAHAMYELKMYLAESTILSHRSAGTSEINRCPYCIHLDRDARAGDANSGFIAGRNGEVRRLLSRPGVVDGIIGRKGRK